MQLGLKHLLAVVVVVGLASCGMRGGEEAASGAAAPAGLATETIEVTPLDAAPAAVATSIEGAAALPAPSGVAPVPTQPAPAAAPEPVVPVQAATATTPHPRPRPTADAAAAAETAPPPEQAKSQPQILCEAAGGVWGQVPESGAYLCQKKTRDGGKVCRAKTDCQGECLAPSGTCAPVTPLLGCNDILDSAGRRMTLCLD